MSAWPVKSPRPQTRKPVYLVQSPPSGEIDKISTGSCDSQFGSPVTTHEQVINYHQDSMAELTSTPQSLGKLKNGYSMVQLHDHGHQIDDEMDGGDERRRRRRRRFYWRLLLTLELAFALFCLLLLGVSKSFSPIVTLQGMTFQSLNVQSGNDASGVITDMLTLNSTITFLYRNPATFFTLHVTSSPIQLSYSHLILASGQINKFSQRRKSKRIIKAQVFGDQVPLYGSVPALYDQRAQPNGVVLPLNITFTLRSRAYVLGRLVKTKVYSSVRCNITFHGDKLGERLDLSNSCSNH